MDNEFESSKFQQTLDKGQEVFGKFGQWIGNQRHFSAIRDSFATFMPLLIVGSFAILVNSVFLLDSSLLADLVGVTPGGSDALSKGWANMSFYISPIFDGIVGATMNFFAVYLAFLFGYFLTKSYEGEALFGGLLSMSAFLVLQPISADAGLKYLGSNGILLAMFAGLSSPTLYNKLTKSGKLAISMPEGVPPAVARSFNALIPLSIVLIIYGLIQPIWGAISYSSGIGSMEEILNLYEVSVTFDYVDSAGNIVSGFSEIIKAYSGSEIFGVIQAGGTPTNEQLISSLNEMGYNDVTNIIITQTSTLLEEKNIVINPEKYYVFNAVNTFLFLPLSNATDSATMVFVVLMMISLFWFFGVHGPNVMSPFVNTFWTTATIANVNLVSDLGFDAALESGQLAIWTETTMNSFAFIGGVGATLALILGVMIFSKVQSTKQIAKIATPTGIFQINEPVIFGFPILLNFRWFIPYVFTTPIIGLIIYYATAGGLLNPVTVLIPWTTPIFLSGFLATLDWRSFIWTFLVFSFAFLSYLPFVIIDTKTQLKVVEKEQLAMKKEEIASDKLLLKTVNLRNKLKAKNESLEKELKILKNQIQEVDRELYIKNNDSNLILKKDEIKENIISIENEIKNNNIEFNKKINKNEKTRIKFDMINDKFENLVIITKNSIEEKINQLNLDFNKFLIKYETKISNLKEKINNGNLFIEKISKIIDQNNKLIEEFKNSKDSNENEKIQQELDELKLKNEKLNNKLDKNKQKLIIKKQKLEKYENSFEKQKAFLEKENKNKIINLKNNLNKRISELKTKKEQKQNKILN